MGSALSRGRCGSGHNAPHARRSLHERRRPGGVGWERSDPCCAKAEAGVSQRREGGPKGHDPPLVPDRGARRLHGRQGHRDGARRAPPGPAQHRGGLRGSGQVVGGDDCVPAGTASDKSDQKNGFRRDVARLAPCGSIRNRLPLTLLPADRHDHLDPRAPCPMMEPPQTVIHPAPEVRDRPRRDGGPGASGLSPSLLSPSVRWPGHGVVLRPSSIARHRGSSMVLERQVFQAKYGRGDELVALFQELNAQMGEGTRPPPGSASSPMPRVPSSPSSPRSRWRAWRGGSRRSPRRWPSRR